MESAGRVSYSIITYPRFRGYLDGTIRDLERTGFFEDSSRLPLWIVSGSPDNSHIEKYSGDKRFVVDRMGEEEAEEIRWYSSGPGLRASKGHWRALSPLRANSGSRFVLIMEDDIRFSTYWIPRFEATLNDLVSRFGDRFLLYLYTPEILPGPDPVVEAYREGRLWVERPIDYGVQAVLYSNFVREVYMYERSPRPIDEERPPGRFMDRMYGRPHDLLLAETVRKSGIPVLATAPSLVQHVGEESGACSSFHKSGSFVD